MPILQQKPVTPSGRFFLKNKVDLSTKRPERALTKCVHRKKGRNAYGRITSRRRGGGHKRLYRQIDFRREQIDQPSKVIALEYDPNRTAHLALLEFEDGNSAHQKSTIGKAGRNRWKGRRPRVRGVAMNPVDHPMGGGEGRTSGGGHPSSPWGQLSKGFPTRKKSKPSNSQILVRRNGRRVK